MRQGAGVLGVVLAALLSGGAAGAQQAPPIARWVPAAPDPRHPFVMDSAHVLSDTAVRALQDSARALQATTGADVVWVTLPSLGGRAAAEAALYLGRTWKVGNAGVPGDAARNRGLVVLFVPDRTTTAGANLRIEVGNGLEGTITDSRSRRISAAMRDDLKAKQYDAAYANGWAAAALLVREDWHSRQRVAAAPVAAPVATPQLSERPPVPGWAVGVIVALLLAALLYMLTRIMGRRLPPAPPTIQLERSDDRADGADTSSAAALAAMMAAEAMRGPTRHDPGSGFSGFDSGGSGSGGSSGGGSSGGSLGGGGGFSGGGSGDSI